MLIIGDNVENLVSRGGAEFAEKTLKEPDDVTGVIVETAAMFHRQLGPGLPESVTILLAIRHNR
ncbi:MAG: hypothetical protein A2076_01280 [Geobacteraceae bacterium GWC2_53_11]|nr:MAG: hypothetical protein A2076_01280 [Geobacteraceae bacterium GWC2_53_11]